MAFVFRLGTEGLRGFQFVGLLLQEGYQGSAGQDEEKGQSPLDTIKKVEESTARERDSMWCVVMSGLPKTSP